MSSTIEPINLDSISPLGFGCYRVAAGELQHRTALRRALSLGCSLIDTASNYSDGRSEELVGEVLRDGPRAFVVTKAGYITQSNEEELRSAGISPSELAQISAESKHSLSPDVLRVQIASSLRRLQRPRLDALLLHNPELYLDCAAAQGLPGNHYDRIRRAFTLLEELVHSGSLRYYGVSSNALCASSGVTNRIGLDQLLEAARSVSASHHFRFVEFPVNLVETEVLDRQADGSRLIDKIKAAGLISLGNRPLNARRGNELFRLAIYDQEIGALDAAAAALAYEKLVTLASDRLRSAQLPHKVMDFAVMQFLRDNWTGIDHPDTVDDIFGGHLFPFVARLWEGTVPEAVRLACGELHGYARLYAKRRLSDKARVLRAELVSAGVIAVDDIRGLAEIAIDFCLQSGVDHVLVGMRALRYVENLSALILRRRAPRGLSFTLSGNGTGALRSAASR